MMYAAMTVSVHDHIHFRCSGHTWIRICAIDTIPGKIVHAAALNLRIKLFVQCCLHSLNAFVNFKLLFFRQFIVMVAFNFSTKL